MKKKINKYLYWSPRVLSITFILFLMLFSLDIFNMNLSFWETVVGLIMHNIPAIILAIVIAISWKREIIGGLVFILAGTMYFLQITKEIISGGSTNLYMISWIITISGPAFLIGILFLINWHKKRT